MDSKDIGDDEKNVQELVAKVEKWMLTEEGKEAIIVVQSDKKLDYATLYLVLRSAANAGFFKYRLAIMKS